MRRGWGGESEAELQPCVRARIVACSRGARAPGKNRGVGERGKAGLGTPGICSIRGPPCPLAVHALGCLSPSAFLPFLANLMPLPHPPHPDAQGRVPPPASSSGRQHDDSVARTLDPDLDDNPSSANAYEAARAARITANRARLASLGVMKAAASARPTLAVKVPPAPHHRRPRPPPSPTTRSLRSPRCPSPHCSWEDVLPYLRNMVAAAQQLRAELVGPGRPPATPRKPASPVESRSAAPPCKLTRYKCRSVARSGEAT